MRSIPLMPISVGIAWKIGLHLTFVLSGVLFAVMDRLTAGKSGGH